MPFFSFTLLFCLMLFMGGSPWIKGVRADGDQPGITVNPTGLNLEEGGTAATLSMIINTLPTADVDLQVAVDNSASQGDVILLVNLQTNDSSDRFVNLGFTTANYSQAQSISVQASEGGTDNRGTLNVSTSSNDPNYNGLRQTVDLNISPSNSVNTTGAGGCRLNRN